MSRQIKIYIYSDYPSESLDISHIHENLASYGFQTEDRGNVIDFLGLSNDSIRAIAEKLSGAVVDDISSDLVNLPVPNSTQVNSEMNRLLGKEDPKGVLYDGYWLQRIFHRAMSEKVSLESGDDYLHLIFTSRLFGTFEDRRYHARVVLTGVPSLISTSGLVEAPAKPREYYFIKGGLVQSGKDVGVLDEMYRGRFVEYDDPKISSILYSYALQALFYHISGKAFCDNKECCLYNSHWQEEVLTVQYQGKPCDLCLKLIDG